MSSGGLKAEVDPNGGGATPEGCRSPYARNDPRHPDYFKTPEALKKRRSKMPAPFTNRRAPLIKVEPRSPGGTLYERRFAPTLGCEIRVKVDESLRRLAADRSSAGNKGDSPPSENSRRLANQSHPRSSSSSSPMNVTGSGSGGSGGKSFTSPEPTRPQMPYGHSSAEKVMWPTPPSGEPEDAAAKEEEVSGAAPRSHRGRGRRRALETPAGAVARRPQATPFDAMPFGHSSAEKKMWPTVQVKRRRVRSPDRELHVPNLLPFTTPAPDKAPHQESANSSAASQATTSSSESHVSDEKSETPPTEVVAAAETPADADTNSEPSTNSKKRKPSDDERAEKEKRREARRKRRKARRTLVPPAATTIEVPPYPFEAIAQFGDEEAPWDESDSRADAFMKLITGWASKVNATMLATYGDEDSILGGVLTRAARLKMERVVSGMTVVADQIRATDEAAEAAAKATVDALFADNQAAKRAGSSSAAAAAAGSAEEELAVLRGETEIHRRLEAKYRKEEEDLEKMKADFLEAERESARIAREKAAAAVPIEVDASVQELAQRADEVAEAAPALMESAFQNEYCEARERDQELNELEADLVDLSLKEEELVKKISALDGLGDHKVSGEVILGLRTPSTPAAAAARGLDVSRFSICSNSSSFSPAEFATTTSIGGGIGGSGSSPAGFATGGGSGSGSGSGSGGSLGEFLVPATPSVRAPSVHVGSTVRRGRGRGASGAGGFLAPSVAKSLRAPRPPRAAGSNGSSEFVTPSASSGSLGIEVEREGGK